MDQLFHVVVSTNNEADVVLFKNLSKTDLKKNFVKNFKAGKDLFVNNQVFKTTELVKVKIIETVQSLEDELEEYHQESLEWMDKENQKPGPKVLSAGRGLYENEIVEPGTDVTDKFISTPPNSSSNLFIRFVYNPWTIRIAGGVIVALIIWWLTKYLNLFS